MNAPVESVPVIQADRDAAADAFKREQYTPDNWIGSVSQGWADSDQLVQAFARHRTNQVAELVKALEAAADYMRSCAPRPFWLDDIETLIASHKGEQP